MCVDPLGFEVPYAIGKTDSRDTSTRCLLFIDIGFIDGLLKQDSEQLPTDILLSVLPSIF